MDPNPLFSIVIPVFNRARTLPGSLQSVLSQDFRDYEVIVIDDGSTDAIDVVARKYASCGVVFLKNEQNRGVGYSRNRGTQAARGSWVVFLDSDSYLVDGALSALASTVQSCEDRVGVVYGRSEKIDDQRKREEPSGSFPRRRWGYREYLQASHIDEALPVTRREILLRFPFEENLGIKRECGTLVWYAIGRAGYEFVWTQQLIQRYEISSDGLSGQRFLAAHPEEIVICNQKIIESFGDDMAAMNRAKLVTLHQKTAFYCIMAGRRPCALRHALLARKLHPFNVRTWTLLALCWIGPRTARRLYPVVAAVAA